MGEDTHLPSLKQHLATIAVVFDLVNRVLAPRRPINHARKLWLNEPEPVGYAKHSAFVAIERLFVKWEA